MNGYQFRRQRPILNFIADFVCLDLLLIIEVDGISHDFGEEENAISPPPKQRKRDSKKLNQL